MRAAIALFLAAGCLLASTARGQFGASQPPSLDDLEERERARAAEAAKPPAAAADPEADSRRVIELLDMHGLKLNASAARASYRIGAGDGLSVRVLRHPEFDADGEVSATGALVMPILGEFQVAGLTADELDRKLTEVISTDYLVGPEVLVSITDYQNMRVLITGSVQNPGLHQIAGPVTLLELLSLAGNFKGRHAETVTIVRGTSAEDTRDDGQVVRVRDTETLNIDLHKLLYEGDLSQNLVLRNNDQIFVPPDEAKIYVFGEVVNPGYFSFHDGMTIYDAIKGAGGFTEFANDKKVRIRRRVNPASDEPSEIRVNLKEMLKNGDISKNVPVQDGDVVIVGSSFFF